MNYVTRTCAKYFQVSICFVAYLLIHDLMRFGKKSSDKEHIFYLKIIIVSIAIKVVLYCIAYHLPLLNNGVTISASG